MPSYKLTPDSVKVEDGYTRFLVTFIKDDKTESDEQNYEVKGTDMTEVYKALDTAAIGFNNMPAQGVVPALVTGKALEVGVEAAKIEASKPKINL